VETETTSFRFPNVLA
jgi:hypothetical protein